MRSDKREGGVGREREREREREEEEEEGVNYHTHHFGDNPVCVNSISEAVDSVLPVDIVSKVVDFVWVPLQVGLGISLQPVHHQLHN